MQLKADLQKETGHRRLPVLIGAIVLATIAIGAWRGWFTYSKPAEVDSVSVNQATDPSDDRKPKEIISERPSLSNTASNIVPGTVIKRHPDDPGGEGWNTEVFSSHLDAQFKIIGQLLKQTDELTAATLSDVADDSFTSSRLRPKQTPSVFQDKSLLVTRGVPEKAIVYHGQTGLARALRELIKPLISAPIVRTKFKVFRVHLDSEGGTCRVVAQISGRAQASSIQISTTWNCRWSVNRKDIPTLNSIEVEDFEQVVGNTKHGPLVADCTESVFRGVHSFDKQLRPGIDHWLGRIENVFGMDVGGWQGIAIADVNRDGLDDLYVTQPGGLPNRLYIQNDDGTVTDLSSAWGVDVQEATHAALFIDVDNDGDQDLIVATMNGLLMLENFGGRQFKLRQAKVLPMAIPYSMSAADYDLDGDLDLFVCCYNRRSATDEHIVFAHPVPYHDANNGGPNVLLQNDGDWNFRHATVAVGLDENNRRFSYAASWEDYDNDGDPDLYVANDFGRNNLYRNDNGKFSDVAAEAGVLDISPGMSACWGDVNNDGRMDLYVSNMFSSAGNRIATQENFQADADAQTRKQFRRHARGNSLFENLGDGRFADVGESGGVMLGRWAWGSKFVDLNNDGWQDIVVANGFITQQDGGDL